MSEENAIEQTIFTPETIKEVALLPQDQDKNVIKQKTIFTPENIREVALLLEDLDENAYGFIKAFQNGKIGVALGYGIEIKNSFENLNNTFVTLIPSEVKNAGEGALDTPEYHTVKSFIQQTLTEFNSTLAHSKFLPLAKFACNLKDLALHTLLTNSLISSVIKLSPEQAAGNYGINSDNIKDIQQYYNDSVLFLNHPPFKDLCPAVISIKNDYDQNFQNFADNLMGVVNTLLHPTDFFAQGNEIIVSVNG